VKDLTTTSYAILSLLAVRSWTTYELAQQMDRSVGNMWPRAASVVYEEPKRLQQRGLADSERIYTGKRGSTVYSITEAGREALARWMETPGAALSMEYEALLKVAFADHGSLGALRDNLAAIRTQTDAEYAAAMARLQEYAETGGPYPDRLPVIALALRYFIEQALAMRRWIEWAESATSEWTGVTVDDGATIPGDAFLIPE